MAIGIIGATGVVSNVDGSTFQAQNAMNKPVDYGSLGAFSYGGFTGILPAALAANSEIFQFRWSNLVARCLITRITIAANVSTTFFAAGVPVQINLTKATGWSAAGTGGTAPTPAATIKKRSGSGSTLVALNDLRIATTAALGAGTKTLEASAMASLAAPGPITTSLNGQILARTTLFEANANHGQGPIVLVQNEGLAIRSVAVPATGTWSAAVTIDWLEAQDY